MTHAELINLWPCLSEFAEDIGVHYGTAKAMRRRNSVAPCHWTKMVEKAAERNIAGVTFDALIANRARSAEATE